MAETTPMPAPKTIFLTHDGKTLPVAEWSARKRLPVSTILSRVRRLGWPL